MIQEAIKLFILSVLTWLKTTLLVISIALNAYFINEAGWLNKFSDIDIEDVAIEQATKYIKD